MIISRRIRFTLAMLIVPTLVLVIFESINICVSDALSEYTGEWFETLLLYSIFLCGIPAFVALRFAFHCPKCGKSLLDMPRGFMLKKGLFYPQTRLWGILLSGKRVNCMFCDWKDDDADVDTRTDTNDDTGTNKPS